ncbi:hypothetical protein HZH68_001880 [Vespula germanica]|uniref:Uncharacterized protein n=1 Tax=Vespula germanica TaxID=30212 RepID=A0A834KUX2_VESGE|nr:hypothetical protein HZH68_001880 [Vespula germanica]
MSVREKEVVLEAGWCLNQPRNAGWGALDPCGWRTEWGGGRSTRPSASKPSQLNLRQLLGLAICPSLPRLLKRLGGPFWGCMLGGPVTFVGPLPAASCTLHAAPKLPPGSA